MTEPTAPVIIGEPIASQGDCTTQPAGGQGKGVYNWPDSEDRVSVGYGFGARYSSPTASSGKSVSRKDMNAILYMLSTLNYYFQWMGRNPWNSLLATSDWGGYDQGSKVWYDGAEYVSKWGGNLQNPTNTDWWIKLNDVNGNTGSAVIPSGYDTIRQIEDKIFIHRQDPYVPPTDPWTVCSSGFGWKLIQAGNLSFVQMFNEGSDLSPFYYPYSYTTDGVNYTDGYQIKYVTKNLTDYSNTPPRAYGYGFKFKVLRTEVFGTFISLNRIVGWVKEERATGNFISCQREFGFIRPGQGQTKPPHQENLTCMLDATDDNSHMRGVGYSSYEDHTIEVFFTRIGDLWATRVDSDSAFTSPNASIGNGLHDTDSETNHIYIGNLAAFSPEASYANTLLCNAYVQLTQIYRGYMSIGYGSSTDYRKLTGSPVAQYYWDPVINSDKTRVGWRRNGDNNYITWSAENAIVPTASGELTWPFMPIFVQGRSYKYGDRVSHEGFGYYSKASNNTDTPGTTSNWEKIVYSYTPGTTSN